jgi:endonuclease YncB( thermonuclease family)
VSRQPVRLIEAGGDDRDKYDRLLRYVELKGEDIGAKLLEGGFVKNYAFFPHDRSRKYMGLERTAKAAGKGLWGACAISN